MKSTKRKTTAEFKQDVYDLVGDEYSVLGTYKNNKTKIKMKHNVCGHEWGVMPNNFLRGTRCPACEKYHHEKLTNSQFINEVKKAVGSEYTVLSKYDGIDTKVKFRHNKCGKEFNMSPYCFLRAGQRCPKCAIVIRNKKNNRTDNDFRKLVKHDGFGEYIPLEKYVNSTTKIKMKHLVCGKEYYVLPYKFLDGHRCPYCNQSHGEHLISKLLDAYGVKYEYPYIVSELKDEKSLHYDFNLKGKKILIEYQGRQHYMPISQFGGEQQFKRQQKHDQMKRDYAKKHGYKLIEVPYTISAEEDIKEYLINHGLEL